MKDKFKEMTLSELEKMGCLFQNGSTIKLKDQDPNGKVNIIYLADVGELELRNRSHGFLTQTRVKKLNGTFVKEGDILIARLPAPLGRACLFTLKSGQYITINDVTIFRNVLKKLDPRYLCYCINSPLVRTKIAAFHSGSSRDRISKRKLGEIKLPIASIQAQKRIASKIESLFSDIDLSVEELKKTHKKMELYTRSLLNTAIRGKLVSQNQNDEPVAMLLEKIKAYKEKLIQEGKLKQDKPLSSPTPEEIPFELPTGWQWARVSTILLSLIYKMDKTSKSLKSMPVLGIEYIRERELDFSPIESVSQKQPASIGSSLDPGDILLYGEKSSTLTNRCAVFKGGSHFDSFNYTLIRLRFPTEFIEPQFIALAINVGYDRWVQQTGQSAATINESKLLNLPIPLPPRSEQIRIVQALHRALDSVKTYKNNLTRQPQTLSILKKSILKQIFEGKTL